MKVELFLAKIISCITAMVFNGLNLIRRQKAFRDQRAHRDRKDLLAILAFRVHKDHQAKLAFKDHKVLLVMLESKDHKDHQAKLAFKDHRGHQAMLEFKDHKGLLAR
jgi:hypothetical protein